MKASVPIKTDVHIEDFPPIKIWMNRFLLVVLKRCCSFRDVTLTYVIIKAQYMYLLLYCLK